MPLIDELTAAVATIKSEMPHWAPGPDLEPDWWQLCDSATAADAFAHLESNSESLNRLNQILQNHPDPHDLPCDDQDSCNLATIVGSAARRSVEALHCILRNVEGMGYVEASGILGEQIAGTANKLVDIDRANEFLEFIISSVEGDADESKDAALCREKTISAIERGHDVDNDGYVPIETIEGTSALSWCAEFAKDATNIIVSSVKELDDDPVEAAEALNMTDRTVLTNEILQRSVALVILGHEHMTTSRAYERLEHAASNAYEVLEDARIESIHNQDEDMGPSIEACAELLDAARQAAAFRTAQAALEDHFSAFINR